MAFKTQTCHRRRNRRTCTGILDCGMNTARIGRELSSLSTTLSVSSRDRAAAVAFRLCSRCPKSRRIAQYVACYQSRWQNDRLRLCAPASLRASGLRLASHTHSHATPARKRSLAALAASSGITQFREHDLFFQDHSAACVATSAACMCSSALPLRGKLQCSHSNI